MLEILGTLLVKIGHNSLKFPTTFLDFSNSVQRNTVKEQKLKHINETEIILLKCCTTEAVRNYDQNLSGRLDSEAACDFLLSKISNTCTCQRIHDMPGIFQNVRNNMRSLCQACLTTSSCNFEQLLLYNITIKYFSFH